MSIRSRIRQAAKPILRMVVHRLDKISLRLYCSPNDWALRLSTGPLYRLRRFLRASYKQASLNGYRMKGQTAGLSHPLDLCLFMEPVQSHYFRDLYFEPGSVLVEELGAFHSDQIREVVTRLTPPPDLVIFSDPETSTWKPGKGEWIRLPATVRMVIPITRGLTWEAFEPGLRYQKTNLKRVKKAGYRYQISHADEDFNFFYDRMCIPTIQARYGDRGKILERDVLYKDFKRGGVLLVSDAEDRPVAGKVYFTQGNVYFDILYGVLDGRQDLLDQGALSAMYQYSLQWCMENGMHRYDGGIVVPLRDDGVYIHKKRWGFSPIMHPWGNEEIIIWLPGSSPAALESLRNHLFIQEFLEIHGDTLLAIYNGEATALPE